MTEPRKPRPKRDDPKQSKRFLEAAKAAEASDDPKDFDKAFRAVASEESRRRGS